MSKRILVGAIVLILAMSALALAGPTFDYEHNIPSNVGDLSFGYIFGEKPLSMTVSATLGDVWGVDGGPDLGWGFAIDADDTLIDFKASLDFSLNEISCWPDVYLDGFELWAELTVHLFPSPCLGPDPCGDPIVDLVFAGGITYVVTYQNKKYTPSIVPVAMVGFHIEP